MKRIKLTVLALAALSLTAATFAETQDQIDLRLGPWLDLHGGGIAIGAPQGVVTVNPDGTTTGAYGRLEHASVLPSRGDGFDTVSESSTSAGTGMMISLIENSANAFHALHPDVVVRVGDIAQTEGGYFYPPHKSHQNGLDADILFMGARDYDSVLDGKGGITARFDKDKNWEYWRSIVAQKIMVGGRIDSVVSMILVAPEIKTALCAWAADKKMLDNPEDRDVMRRLRPTEGHDDHFHIRLRCSPYHTQCTGTFSPGPQTGCETLAPPPVH